MGEATTVAVLNSWGATRDAELVALKADLGATQAGVTTAFEQARGALLTIVSNTACMFIAQCLNTSICRRVGSSKRSRSLCCSHGSGAVGLLTTPGPAASEPPHGFYSARGADVFSWPQQTLHSLVKQTRWRQPAVLQPLWL
jgi:hypothetical protein